jgi:hypothetical protein
MRFVRELIDFMRTTAPAEINARQFGEVVRRRSSLTAADVN